MTWRLWIDTGGTFTDAVALDPEDNLKTAKILSNSTLRGTILGQPSGDSFQIDAPWLSQGPGQILPGDFFATASFRTNSIRSKIIQYNPHVQTLTLDHPTTLVIRQIAEPIPFEIQFDEEAPVLAARLITGTAPGRSFPPMQLRLATTRGTNALLEKTGAPTILLVTKGFADLLKIGNQQRPDLFTLDIEKPTQLTDTIIEIPERIEADGTIALSLEIEVLAEYLTAELQHFELDAHDLRYSVAVALLNSHANPIHELSLCHTLKNFGFKTVTASHEVAPFIRYLQRTETTVVDAYLAPLIRGYLNRIAEHLDQTSRIFVMTSAGGLQSAATYRAKDSLLSGPAGGVAGAAGAAMQSGINKIIAFDMGGTSTDVARYNGAFEYEFEHSVGSAHLMAPALSIHTVAAGGGSICSFDGRRLHVGPQSAGAEPGPACYGRGGPLTLTDINLLLNRINPARFGIPVNRIAAQTALTNLLNEINTVQNDNPIGENQLLHGCLDIANERMADAVRKISIRRGFEPAEYTLTAFGGAGGQHACALADRLDISRIIIPENASLLSALGLSTAAVERIAEQQLLRSVDRLSDSDFQSTIDELRLQAMHRVAEDGILGGDISIRRIILGARFVGQDATIDVDLDPQSKKHHTIESASSEFTRAYENIFSQAPENHEIQFVNLRIVAASGGSMANHDAPSILPITLNPELRTLVVSNDPVEHTNQEVERAELRPDQLVEGPALIVEDHSVTVVASDWAAGILEDGTLMLERWVKENDTAIVNGTDPYDAAEAVQLELFTNRFCALTEEMGEMLRRTALSTNVKERLDFSCALLDADAELVVNAPHIPVHLGAIGECVRQIRTQLDILPGDVLITNHPAFGGSHLPDITVITPVFLDDDQNKLLGYVANRAHHAEIGGTRPGSMPPDATTLAEEGVVIHPAHLIRQGIPRWESLIATLTTNAPHPTRACLENIEDLRAAVAANHRGHQALISLARDYQPERIRHYMQALKAQAESHTRAVLQNLPDQNYHANEELDDGTPIQVNIAIEHVTGSATVDFTGSGSTHPGNLNATPAIVRSAVMYVLRLLIDEPIPLNEGMMKPIEIILPENSILNPRFSADPADCPAVVGGNVETSQRVVDTLLKAFNLAACSQGTMNNILFGNEQFGYYETVAGGSGASPRAPGASAVHTHMTNTAITDAEIIEHRYPVRINRFAIRRDSGGKGDRPGGDGIIREYEALAPIELSVLTQHRTTSPYAQNEATPGRPGSQHIIRRNSGEHVSLGSIDQPTLYPGDRLILETPGGGGSNNTSGSGDS